jgi:hypothetical protein
MIVRVFGVRIRKGREATFKNMVQEQSIPWLEQSDGMMGYFPGEPLSESSREFVMDTLWQDVEAFAAEQWKTPVVTEDDAPLSEETSAQHYTRFDRAPDI